MSSEGEAKNRHRHKTNPFEHFLANLHSPDPENSSTSTPPSTDSSTLSDLPSIAKDRVLPHRKTKGKEMAQLLKPSTRQSQKDRVSLPYHKQFPLQVSTTASPGEVRKDLPLQTGTCKAQRKPRLLVRAHSDGELDLLLQNKDKWSGQTKQFLREFSANSPGEFPPGTNKMRNGIDVIRISSSSPQCSSGRDSSHVQQQQTPSLSRPSQLTSRRLKMFNMEPARVVQVAPPSAVGEGDDVIRLSSRPSPARQKSVRDESDDVIKLNSRPSFPGENKIVKSTSADIAGPSLSARAELSMKSQSVPPQLSPSSSSASTVSSLPAIPQLKEKEAPTQRDLEVKISQSQPELHSFWEESATTGTVSLARLSRRQRNQNKPEASTGLETRSNLSLASKPLNVPVPSTGLETGSKLKGMIHTSLLNDQLTQSNNTSSTEEEEEEESVASPTPNEGHKKDGLVSDLCSPVRTQLSVSVPSAAVEELSSPTSPSPSPTPSPDTYSSDFDFSMSHTAFD